MVEPAAIIKKISVPAPTFQTIMKAGWEAYEKCHALPACVRNAVTALLPCRTDYAGRCNNIKKSLKLRPRNAL